MHPQRVNVGQLALAESRGAGDAGDVRQVREAEGHDRGRQSRSEHGDREDGQQDPGEREQQIEEAGCRRVHRSLAPGRRDGQRHRQRDGQQDDQQRPEQAGARADDQPREQVAAGVIGSQRVRG